LLGVSFVAEHKEICSAIFVSILLMGLCARFVHKKRAEQGVMCIMCAVYDVHKSFFFAQRDAQNKLTSSIISKAGG
jgi:hypothetical protein